MILFKYKSFESLFHNCLSFDTKTEIKETIIRNSTKKTFSDMTLWSSSMSVMPLDSLERLVVELKNFLKW